MCVWSFSFIFQVSLVCHCAVKNIIRETEVLVNGGETVGGKERERDGVEREEKNWRGSEREKETGTRERNKERDAFMFPITSQRHLLFLSCMCLCFSSCIFSVLVNTCVGFVLCVCVCPLEERL